MSIETPLSIKGLIKEYQLGPQGMRTPILQEMPPQKQAIKGLTNRQSQILSLAKTSLSNGEIATVLSISTRTVEKHFEGIYDKLGVHDRVAAILKSKTDDA